MFEKSAYRAGDRLDESSARRIAKGRLTRILERMDQVTAIPNGLKPRAKAEAITERWRRAFGPMLLLNLITGRVLHFVAALPDEDNPGQLFLMNATYRLRSDSFLCFPIALLTGHAIARLMERRRSAIVEEVLSEELDTDTLVRALNNYAAGPVQQLKTKNGKFMMTYDVEMDLHIAKTWIEA